MLKKNITYTDFNGVTQTNTYYFHLSESEITRMEVREYRIFGDITKPEEVTTSGGLVARLEAVSKSGSGRLLIDFFENLIMESYGERSDDGQRFLKSEEIYDRFRFSPAYDEFFMELVTDSKAAANFVNNIIPKLSKAQEAANKPQDFKKSEKQNHLKVVDDVVETVGSNDSSESEEVSKVVQEDSNLREVVSDDPLYNISPEQLAEIRKQLETDK